LNYLNELFEIVKFTLPSLIILLVVSVMVRKYFEDEKGKRREKILLKNQDFITPLRLQAYERYVLFLERISPESLLLRINTTGISSKQLHSQLLETIRSEFEHNLAQQLYISGKAWEMIKAAKTNTLHLINITAEKVQPDSPSFTLSKAILEATMGMKKIPTTDAISFLREELNTLA